jgi:hypothetical protein
VVQRRLHARNGHDHHIHRYFSHRLAFHQKRYRMFNEVCDLGNLAGALEWYSREWRRRRNHYRWIEANPDLSEVYWDYVEGNATESDVNEQREAAWKFAYAVKGWPVEKNDGGKKRKLDSVSSSVVKKVGDKFDDLDDASDFGEWRDTDLPAKPQDVIPEAFLWRVFDQLLDAFHIMGTGGDEGPENEKWQEIVHRDVHLQNIFVKGKEGAHRKAKDADASDENDSFVGYKAEDVSYTLQTLNIRNSYCSFRASWWPTLTRLSSIFKRRATGTPITHRSTSCEAHLRQYPIQEGDIHP